MLLVMKILGIESSCDETAAAVVEDGKRLLSNAVASSVDIQAQYGGVVPEFAARSHMEVIMPVVQQALSDADCTWDDIDAIAVTHGAGLNGSLLIGVLAARTLAIVKNKPLYAINHVEAHIYANFLTETPLPGYEMRAKQPEFPMMGLIVSGGHSQLVVWQDHGKYQLLGQTQDDAVGEAFDKVAKIIGLPYPGGISVSVRARLGDPLKYKLPKARMEHRYDFSFSGLKTAVLRTAQAAVGKDFSLPSIELPSLLNQTQKDDIAASFERVAYETLVDKTVVAYREFAPKSFVIGGGVAANAELRRQLAERVPLPIEYPDRKLCGDNGAMVATLGYFHVLLGMPKADPYTLETAPNLSM
jgi:N6-L-threonylcarbamoyladenine synthase